MPGDAAVVGFDDIPGAGWAAYSLSTVQRPVDAMIEETLDSLERDALDKPGEVRFRGRMIFGESFRGPLARDVPRAPPGKSRSRQSAR